MLETEACDVGFRRVEISNGLLKLNGKPLLIRGVNRHAFNGAAGIIAFAIGESGTILEDREIIELRIVIAFGAPVSRAVADHIAIAAGIIAIVTVDGRENIDIGAAFDRGDLAPRRGHHIDAWITRARSG